MLLQLVSLAAIGCASPLDTPSELVERLAGEDPRAAIEALVALEPAETLPLLVSCVRLQPEAHAWQASRALREIAEAKPKDAAWNTEAPALGAVLLDGERAAHNRLLAGMALRGLDKPAKPLFEDLAQLFGQEQPAAVHLGAALALSGLGKSAVGELKDSLSDEGYVRLLWTATAIGASGKDGKALAKSLAKRSADEDSLAVHLTCRSMIHAIEEVAGLKAAKKPNEVRAGIRPTWEGGKGGVNFGGLAMIRPEDCARMIAGVAKVELKDPATLSLPSSLESPYVGNTLMLGDGVQAFSLHVTQEVCALAGRLEKEEFEDYDAWAAASDKVLATAELLAALDPLVPSE